MVTSANLTDTAADAILRARHALAEQLLERLLCDSPEGKAIKQHDEAYKALTGKTPPPWFELPDTSEDSSSDSDASVRTAPKPVVRRPRSGPPVIKLILKIMDEHDDPDRVWNYAEMAAEFEKRGKELTGKDPKARLRTAVSTLVKDRDVTRVGTDGGEFKRLRSATVSPLTPQIASAGSWNA